MNSERQVLLDALKELHPDFAKSRTVVLHRSATDGEYSAWKQKRLAGQSRTGTHFSGMSRGFGGESDVPPDLLKELASVPQTTTFSGTALFGVTSESESKTPPKFHLTFGQRNTTALFGTGLIDAIPNSVLIDAAQAWHAENPDVSGRVARLANGKVGRFGWKAQMSNLHDFTMTACAVELGLHVPDHAQASLPHQPEYQPRGFDLDQAECHALVGFLRELSPPTRTAADHAAITETRKAGERLFGQIGCAACHRPTLGEVTGIFSDLLLHDMGPDNGDSGSYGVLEPLLAGADEGDPLPDIANFAEPPKNSLGLQSVPAQAVGALTQEWRTPPLWGVRDSAPYMHDGRAHTLEQAISLHGGEGRLAAHRFFRRTAVEQQTILAFLRSLVAPDVVVANSK